jgi:hypothetical protein
MRALEISMNGKKLCVAGIGDDGVLSAVVQLVANVGLDDLFLEVGGRINPSNQQVRWLRPTPLQLRDEIQIRVVEVDRVDEPVQKQEPKLPAGRHIGGIIGPY